MPLALRCFIKPKQRKVAVRRVAARRVALRLRGSTARLVCQRRWPHVRRPPGRPSMAAARVAAVQVAAHARNGVLCVCAVPRNTSTRTTSSWAAAAAPQQTPPTTQVGAARSSTAAVCSLPACPSNSRRGSDNVGEICAISQRELQAGDHAWMLPCGHIYDVQGVRAWHKIQQSNGKTTTCPMCQKAAV